MNPSMGARLPPSWRQTVLPSLTPTCALASAGHQVLRLQSSQRAIIALVAQRRERHLRQLAFSSAKGVRASMLITSSCLLTSTPACSYFLPERNIQAGLPANLLWKTPTPFDCRFCPAPAPRVASEGAGRFLLRVREQGARPQTPERVLNAVVNSWDRSISRDRSDSLGPAVTTASEEAPLLLQ